jgi:hypothetical protein
MKIPENDNITERELEDFYSTTLKLFPGLPRSCEVQDEYFVYTNNIENDYASEKGKP